MNINNENEQQQDGFIYRLFAAISLLVLFVTIAMFIMTFTGAFERSEDDAVTTNDLNSSYIEVAQQPDAETTEPLETEPEVTVAPPVTVAPDIVVAYDPGTVNSTAAFNSDLLGLYPETVLQVTDDAGAEYLSKIIFLGDSTTYGLKRYGMLTAGKETTQVWTPANGTLTLYQTAVSTIVYPNTGEEILISEAVERNHPEIMVITLGVNGIAFLKEDYFKSEYVKLVESIQQISPNTKIILQSIFPVAASYANQDQINNEKINAANGWIVEVAKNCGVKYLDTASALVGIDGFLPEHLQNGDGMHLNEAGFKIELDYIRTHAYN